MTRKKGTHYTPEFKHNAVQLALQDDITVKQVAEDLGLRPNILHRWIKEARESQQQGRPVFTGRGNAALTDLEKRIKALERENEILRQEREILKLAAKFFAKEMP